MNTLLIITGLLALSVVWFLFGVLFAKRNPKYMETIDNAYKKGRSDAEREVKEKLKQAEAYIKSKTGSVEISPVGELTKYLLRFGVPLVGVFCLVAVLNPDMIFSVLYKCCLILAGYTLAELVWVIGYKRSFARIEREGNLSDESKRSILIFRGMLHASIILGLTLGL